MGVFQYVNKSWNLCENSTLKETIVMPSSRLHILDSAFGGWFSLSSCFWEVWYIWCPIWRLVGIAIIYILYVDIVLNNRVWYLSLSVGRTNSWYLIYKGFSHKRFECFFFAEVCQVSWTHLEKLVKCLIANFLYEIPP